MANGKTDQTKNHELTASDYEKMGRQLESLIVGYNPARRKIFWTNFLLGIVKGFGAVLGATIGIAILIYILSLFSHIPLIGPFVHDVKQTVNSTPAR